MTTIPIEIGPLATALRYSTDPTAPVEELLLELLTRARDTAVSILAEYALDAPTAVCEESQIRIAGFLMDHNPASARQWIDIFSLSGAKSLCSYWHIPPAVCGA